VTREVRVGNLRIGGNNPIVIQSMCSTDTNDVSSTAHQINQLAASGCQLVRIAIPNLKSISAIKEIKKKVKLPIVGDIHFDYKIAIAAAEICDKIRINPGNIGSEKKIMRVVDACKKNGIPIRIGVNMGSLHKTMERKFGHTPVAMVESALEYILLFEKLKFNNLVVSLKASDVRTTVEANRLFSRKSNYPLHLGITEAGTVRDGTIKNSIGIGALLLDNIGSTIRVSLTSNPLEEIPVAISILKSLGFRKGRTVISCPTCGRTHGNLIEIVENIENMTADIDKQIVIAIMGCEVNGPGEAKNADIGVALGPTKATLFKHGKIIKSIENNDIEAELVKEIRREIHGNRKL